MSWEGICSVYEKCVFRVVTDRKSGTAFAIGLGQLYVAFQSHNLLEGAMTARGVLVGIAALLGFLFVHDALHRVPRALRSPARDRLDDYFMEEDFA